VAALLERPWFKWVKEMGEDFMAVIHQRQLSTIKDDVWKWAGRYLKEYTVKDAFSKIINVDSSGHEEVFCKLWKTKSSPTSLMCGGDCSIISRQIEIDYLGLESQL